MTVAALPTLLSSYINLILMSFDEISPVKEFSIAVFQPGSGSVTLQELNKKIKFWFVEKE